MTKNIIFGSLLFVASLLVSGCSLPNGNTPLPLTSIVIVNEGNYMSSNADITGYNPLTDEVADNLFSTANNGAAMGDAPGAVVNYNSTLFLSLSGSAKVYAIDPITFELKGKITGIDNPRSFAFVNKTRAYLSHLYEGKITIFNPDNYEVISTISLPNNVENMIIDSDGTILANEWSYGKRLVRIDPTKSDDAVIDALEVGIQPTTIVADAQGKLWTLCDGGGWDENPIGYEAPSIVRVGFNEQGKMEIEQKFTLPFQYNNKLTISANRDVIYYTSENKVYAMSINATSLPTTPLIEQSDIASFYNFAVNTFNGEIYCTDAVDYKQNGTVYRYDSQGTLIDSFTAGINPSLFAF